MILPKEIKTRHKIRDSRIIKEYIDGHNQTDIAQKFDLSQARISDILKMHADLALRGKDWEKVQRLHVIKRQLLRPEVQTIAVSPDKWIDAWRREFESENVINSVQNFLQINLPPGITNRLTEKPTP